MQIAVFGMGYVGTVTAAVLAQRGHQVVGVEVSPQKVARLQRGRAPFREPGLDDVLAGVIWGGSLQVTTDPDAARDADLFLVCVGTPSFPDGSLDLSAVQSAMTEIGLLLGEADGYPVVVLRSTVLPSELDGLVSILTRCSGKMLGPDFGFCANPEFLREGSALRDFNAPPMTLIGEHSRRAGDLVSELYTDVEAPLIRTTCKTAMLAKYVSNAWHALKVTFANEVNTVARHLGVSGVDTMAIVTQDTVLNISSAYLRPGFAYGGSCLPKDLAALLSSLHPSWTPVLSAIPRSNGQRIQGAVDSVLASGRRRVAVVGLSFKTGTDDLRESPYVVLIDALIAAGLQVRIFDPDVPPDRAGKYTGYLASLDSLRGWAQCWVVGKPDHLAPDAIPSDAMVVDLNR